MSPRTAKQFEEIRESSRRKILDAAMELFAVQGYNGTSISQIAVKADVAKGLIYNYFKSKSELMHQIIYDSIEDTHGYMERIMNQPSPGNKFEEMINLAFEFMKVQPKLSKITIGIALQVEMFPDLTEFIQGKYTGFMPMLAGLLQEMGIAQPEMEAQLIVALLDGLALQRVVVGDALDLEAIQAFLVQKYGQ
jgi:AcrR family transcriptional regulator